ncbi:MAG: presqualene diphosphate synthase HpnD [Caulobacteraceae bacterium]
MSHRGAMSTARQTSAPTPGGEPTPGPRDVPAPSQAQAGARSQAAGSSFYTAMRLMPEARREAMFAIYSFCRQVDDIADDPGPSRQERTALLGIWRADIAALFAGSPGARTAPLAAPLRRYALEQADFLAVIDGMQMDVDEDIRAPSYERLDLYCDRVASAVGRLSVRVFGMDRAPGIELAHHLGRALQLTNILRDIDEDAAIGRLYLPAEALAVGAVPRGEPTTVVDHPGIDAACRFVARKAHAHYLAAERIMSGRPAGGLHTPRLMSAVYGEILERMEKVGWASPRRRVKLGKGRLAWLILTRGLLG